MFRITCTLSAGHDMQSVTFHIRAANAAFACSAAMTAMRQLGWKMDAYTMTTSQNLEA